MVSISEDLRVIRLSGVEFRKLLFADDTSFILDCSVKFFETLVRNLENLSYISGSKLNAKKCQVLRIGKMEKSIVIYLKKSKISVEFDKSQRIRDDIHNKKKRKTFFSLT